MRMEGPDTVKIRISLQSIVPIQTGAARGIGKPVGNAAVKDRRILRHIGQEPAVRQSQTERSGQGPLLRKRGSVVGLTEFTVPNRLCRVPE